MFRLMAATLVAGYAVLQIFGDPADRPDVTREAPETLSLASFVGMSDNVVETSLAPLSSMSEAEAVTLALAAGKKARTERLAKPVVRLGALAKETTSDVAPKTVAANANQDYWYVSGSKVNLRQGPSTRNAVVAQVALGTEATVLDRRDGWMQIETTQNGTSGWIFGKFLNEKKPG
jgi:uncharacterized protein YgiM (DUF1202 family)